MTIERLIQKLNKYKHTKQPFKEYSTRNVRINRFPMIIQDINEINDIYGAVKSAKLSPLIRTESGKSIKKTMFNAVGVYEVKVIKNTKNNVHRGVILTVILRNNVWVFKFGQLTVSDDSKMTGTKAFHIFKKMCEEEGINLDNYKIENGVEVKSEMPSPIICNYSRHRLQTNVFHIDLNKAWPSSTCEAFPELEKIYAKLDKTVINPLNGYFQSKHCNFEYCHLAKAGVAGCNRKIRELCANLEEQGFIVLGVNTDGIWAKDFLGDRIYHDENEGEGMHKWKIDHQNCKWYSTGDGQYFYYENDKFTPVLRGYYLYESIKPRDKWDEEDYFKAIHTEVNVIWDDEEGYKIYEKYQNN